MKRQHNMMLFSAVLSASIMAPFGNIANANHATLKVVNDSSYPIMKFFASPYWYKRYTRDLLGDYKINPGQTWTIDLSDGDSNNCIYDVKAVLRNGQVFEDRINVCSKVLTIYDR
jgi:hypothetical protein